MEYAIGYVAVIFALQAIAAVRTPREDCQVVVFATVLWPLMIVLVGGSLLLDWIGWGFDAVKGTRMFGFRRPGNTEVRGFAITMFFVEFQMWKSKKA